MKAAVLVAGVVALMGMTYAEESPFSIKVTASGLN